LPGSPGLNDFVNRGKPCGLTRRDFFARPRWASPLGGNARRIELRSRVYPCFKRMEKLMGIAFEAKVPSIDKCYKLLKRYHVPDHIVEHSKTVCKVAVLLAEELNEQGENLCISEIQAAALLHDITKMEGINTGQDLSLIHI